LFHFGFDAMTYGFLATNQNNQVLVSSDTRNLHFLGKYINPTVVKSTDYYGGLRYLRYSFDCSVTPVPFYTVPSPGAYYSIARIANVSSGHWEVDIITNSTNANYPELYVFCDPRGTSSTEQFGMMVYRDDGTPSFDSRKRPLAVIGGGQITHPTNPRNAGIGGLSARYCGSEAGYQLAPDNESASLFVGSIPAKPMFHYSSLAQAERQAQFYDEESDCTGFDYGVCIGYSVSDRWWSTYWAFYRGGLRIDGTNSVRAGWITVEWGCNWTHNSDSNFIGIDTGGSSGVGGSWPYSNETINLSSAAVIMADAARYD
jgi:hypothetical protein